MSEDTKYNGWTNYETWLVNLHYGEYLYDILHEYEPGERNDPANNAEMCEEYVNELVSEGADFDSCSLVSDVIGSFLRQVNWHEIAEHANQD